MDLAPELRNEVYKSLLCPHPDGSQYRPKEKIRDYGMEPAILRTSKQVYKEASRVLYGCNDLFLIRTDAHIYKLLKETEYHNFLEDFPITKVHSGKTDRVPVVILELSMLEKYLPKEKPLKKKTQKGKKGKMANRQSDKAAISDRSLEFIGFLWALPKFLRYFTFEWHPFDSMQSSIVVYLDNPIARSSERRGQMISDLLEYLCEARGLGRAVILAPPEHSVDAAKTAKTMMKGLTSLKEASRMVDAYQRRISKQLKERRWNHACDTLGDALGFHNLVDTLFKPNGGMGSRPRKIPRFEGKKIKTQWAYISCCLKVGRTAEVHHLIRNKTFKYRPPEQRTEAQKQGHLGRVPDAHCALGRAYMIEGALNSAAYSFLQALFLKSRHEDANEAVDCLEERLARSSNPEDVLARLNVQGVLDIVRHRGHIAADEREELLRGFKATCGEMEGMIRKRDWDTVSIVSDPNIAASIFF